jgi:hypothetical protein
MDISTLLVISLLIGQVAHCMLSSRCSEINTPCLQIKRDVIPAEDLKMPEETMMKPPMTDASEQV